jgi:hypothetical protein
MRQQLCSTGNRTADFRFGGGIAPGLRGKGDQQETDLVVHFGRL